MCVPAYVRLCCGKVCVVSVRNMKQRPKQHQRIQTDGFGFLCLLCSSRTSVKVGKSQFLYARFILVIEELLPHVAQLVILTGEELKKTTTELTRRSNCIIYLIIMCGNIQTALFISYQTF